MKYERILTAVAGTPWAIRREKGEAIVGFLVFAAKGGRHTAEEVRAIVSSGSRGLSVDGPSAIDANFAAEGQPGASRGQTIAVLSLSGIISPRIASEMDVSSGGGTSAEGFARRFKAAVNDDNVGGIIIDVDSPGGNVLGVPEAAEVVRGARGSKPIVAVANYDACSAAYWLASAATEFVASPSAEVGSIGVYTYHEDVSKALEMDGVKVTLVRSGPNKAETFPAFPLTDEARAHMQSRVDAYYNQFVGSVAAHRGLDVAAVKDRFGGGRAFGAVDALDRGMVDRVATMDEEIARMAALLSKKAGGAGRGAADLRRRAALW